MLNINGFVEFMRSYVNRCMENGVYVQQLKNTDGSYSFAWQRVGMMTSRVYRRFEEFDDNVMLYVIREMEGFLIC